MITCPGCGGEYPNENAMDGTTSSFSKGERGFLLLFGAGCGITRKQEARRQYYTC